MCGLLLCGSTVHSTVDLKYLVLVAVIPDRMGRRSSGTWSLRYLTYGTLLQLHGCLFTRRLPPLADDE